MHIDKHVSGKPNPQEAVEQMFKAEVHSKIVEPSSTFKQSISS